MKVPSQGTIIRKDKTDSDGCQDFRGNINVAQKDGKRHEIQVRIGRRIAEKEHKRSALEGTKAEIGKCQQRSSPVDQDAPRKKVRSSQRRVGVERSFHEEAG